MNWNMINLLLVLSTASALPQNIKMPEIMDFSPPEEINALQNSQKVQRSISDHVPGQNSEGTIKEVEELIKRNPDLPRLTRGEILDILDNITRQDQQNLLNVISKDAERDPKALMVVKAYTPLGSGEVNVEEFYTKPPVTTIVEDDPEEQLNTDQVVSPASTYFRRKPTKSTEEKKITNVERKKPYRGNSNFKTTTTLSSTPRTRSTTTTERLTTSFSTTTKLPSTTRKELKRRRRPPVTTTTTSTSTMMAITTYRPRGRLPPRKEIIYANHKYPEDISTTRPSVYSSSGIRVVEPPKFEAHKINYDLEDLIPEEGEHQEMFVPMTGDQGKKDYPDDKVNSISEPSIELEIPDHLKKVVADLNLAAMKDPDSVSVTSIIAPSEKPESEKIKDILASLGVLPPSSTSTEMPDAKLVAESLSPDMQDLLKSFGLLPNPSKNDNEEEKNSVAGFNPEKAEIHPESYVGFKPLPEDSKGRKEMEELLEQFGLLDKHNRKGKSIKKGEAPSKNEDLQVEQINLDVIPEDFQPLLHEMGFGGRSGRKIREKAHPNNINEKTSESKVELTENTAKTIEKQHVFNPTESEYVTDEEIQKLGRLLEIMKKLEELNGTITEEDMKHIDQKELKDLLNSLKPPPGETIITLDDQHAPNPVEYDLSLNKNEVKRQEATTTEKVETVTVDEAATEETKTPSIKDLEDSFGGSTSAVTEALPETTTPKRTGFYYLLDWNTFFEIDDQKGKRVNLRFQPKVGDPKRFLSVSVP